MPNEEARRKWSFITIQQLEGYLDEASRVIAFCRAERISFFGAAVAGAGFIRQALEEMGGDPSWWLNLITAKNPADCFSVFRHPPGKH